MPETNQNVDTTQMWEISRYVEAHPDDYEQRWRLAKKLYAAWEYRLALEHLQVLKNEWKRKVNISRYLAATYYRMGRYDEAVQELREAIEQWPNELGLREQAARVLETQGNRESARQAWQEIRDLEPNHPMANSAVRRLSEIPQPTAENELHIGDSDSGINLSPGQVCPNCGAQNSDDFDRCWQCHAPLYAGNPTPHSTSRPRTRSKHDLILGMSQETARLVGSLVVVGLLTLCVYGSVKLLLAWHGGSTVPVVRSLDQLYTEQLGLSRVISGAVAVLFWPLLLSLGIRLSKPGRAVSGSLLTLCGFITGAIAFLASWIPLPAVIFAPLVPAIFSLPLLMGVLQLPPKRAIIAWAVQLALAGPLILIAFSLAEYIQTGEIFNPLTDIPAARGHHIYSAGLQQQGTTAFPDTTLPFEAMGIVWPTTGSAWLDHRAGEMTFVVATPVKEPAFRFEIQDSTGTRVYDDVRTAQFSRQFRIKPGESYNILVLGPPGEQVAVSATGFLVPRRSPDPGADPAPVSAGG